VNTGASWLMPQEAEARVLRMQTKLHRWADAEPERRFGDLFNLVYDPAFMLVAWRRVRNNRGARTAGVDGLSARSIEARRGVECFLAELRGDLRARTFQPLPVRERMIPKPGSTKRRRLGIATVRDRTVQAALKLVLEPIFEADFRPCSYGFRPGRRAHDAIAEVHFYTSRSYEWVLEADIEACFDQISHSALMARVRQRVADKRMLALVKAFLKAGILSEDGLHRDTNTGTPQGGILSPVLANVALSVLDDWFIETWQANSATYSQRRRQHREGHANWRLVRYADDFVLTVRGTREHAEALRDEVAAVLAPMGLRLSDDKTRVVHIDQGLDFLGWRIQRHRKRGTRQHYVYVYPSKRSLERVKTKIRELTARDTNPSLAVLLHRLNPVLRGWTNYYRHGVSKQTFSYLRAFTWQRVVGWLRKKHRRATWKQLRRRYLPGWWPTEDGVTLFNPAAVPVRYYRYRGERIPTPWSEQTTDPQETSPNGRSVESPVR
jgi:RNA-directed DNA polymerase